jgi:phage/plasmid-like protein (TIGR03299 family)
VAHEITSRDNLFTVRQAAWHGLGNVLSEYPMREEAQKIAHPWEPVAEPVYRGLDIAAVRGRFEDVLDGATEADEHGEPWPTERLLDSMAAEVTREQEARLIEQARLNARSDDGYPLGVVNSTFELVTNTEMWDIAEALQTGDDRGDVMFETGGSLKGGRKVWILIRLKDPVHVNGDPRGATIPYYALQNAHDGSGSFRGQATFTRIVCDNTAQAADLDAQMRGTEFEFQANHTKNVARRIEEARAALAGWRQSVDDWVLFSEHMAAFPVSSHQAAEYLERFIPMPKGEIISDIVRANIEQARAQWTGHLNSVTCEGPRSALTLVNASIEYSQHSRKAMSAESAFKRAYLDKSRLTAKAVELARAVAGA